MEDIVTVGLDGSSESLSAAHWGAAEAHRRGWALRLLHAWVLLAPAPRGASSDRDQNYWADRIVGDTRDRLQQQYPELSIVPDLVADEAPRALLGAAASSRILVLGSRGLKAVEGFFLGDTSLFVTARAEQPVVLVRAVPEPAALDAGAQTGGVVVALSLHGGGDSVLRFAFEAADSRRAPLHVVHGTNLPITAYTPWGVDTETVGEVRQEAQDLVTAALLPWRDRYPQVEVVDTVRLESPARTVTRAAEHGGLLVVGRRRHRPPLAPHLGPVAHAAVHHAACPVAVVPHD
ncbi:universal stress protein [Streptomyces palmae]|uniref:Universal stress protein n=1 Tax=Streptomyces palmae TaxID=1701085 RepID=A0A4Z0HAE3_9ACTN|nr:universal stress protein [Streptomyces palmae]TGB15190.1 universal stress protein [Streptomyces palmae]